MFKVSRPLLLFLILVSSVLQAQEKAPVGVVIKDFIHSPGMLEEFGAPPGLNIRDFVEVGLYPLGVVIKNISDKTLIISKETFTFAPVNVELVAPQLHRHVTMTSSLLYDSCLTAAMTGWIIGMLDIPKLVPERWYGHWSRFIGGGFVGLLYYIRGYAQKARITNWLEKVSDAQSQEMSRVLLPHSKISMFLLLDRSTYFGSFPLVIRTFPGYEPCMIMPISVFEHDIEGLYVQLHNSQMPDAVKREVSKEIDRLRELSLSSSEGPLVRTYIDWVLSLPWSLYAQEPTSFAEVREVLNKEHYGLEKAKERVLDILAMRMRNQEAPPPIICLVGPPGTGKTSLARAIAASLKRPFERISVGGVDDEAVIRGHRRTYIGAIPGRFISALKKASVSNPVILIDEIDKMGNRHSDAARAALLEILDHEQNNAFEDHYLGVPFDFSQVLFITTANTIENIPDALRDRMEIIEVTSYTEQEKIKIARDCLWPRALEKVNIEPQTISLDDAAIQFIIRQYTLEAGIRELDRLITTIGMKAARALLDNQPPAVITTEVVREYLGPSRALYDAVQKMDTVGVVNGLGAFPVGGIAFPVQVTLMPGAGKVHLTGKLGKMIQESAEIGISYLRAHAKELHVADNAYNTIDVHIHMPAAALSKDGPSAGIAITTALISAYTQQKVRCCFGMTGEIDLEGRVLPIGSLKEKVLAASRQGITHIVAPRANQVDFESFKDLVPDMTFIWAESIDQVLDAVLIKPV